MITKLSPRVLARAQEAAEELKKQLEPRVLGAKRAASACNCGKKHSGVSKAVEIVYKKAHEDDADTIGLWHLWAVRMEETKNPHMDSYFSLSDFVPAAELIPLFRKTFDPIGIPVTRAKINFYTRGLDDQFKSGGKTSIVSQGTPTLIRPIKPNDIWHAADVRLDRNVPRYEPADLLMTCGIDPFSVHYGTRDLGYYKPGAGIFAIHDPDNQLLIPIVRLDNVNLTRGVAQVEVAQGVEFFSASS